MTAPDEWPGLVPAEDRPELLAAVGYVLDGAARLVADGDGTASAGLLEGGAAACAVYDLPAGAAAAVFGQAAFWLARASGYQPLDPGDPVIERALAEIAGYPPDRQARLLTYASRRAAGERSG